MVTNNLANLKNSSTVEGHVFESGTLEGLMKALSDNNSTMMGVYDEFSTFHDSLDKG